MFIMFEMFKYVIIFNNSTFGSYFKPQSLRDIEYLY